MAFNPALPATNTPQSSAEMRAQFTGLKSLIDAVPASPAIQSAVTEQVATLLSGVNQLTLTISNPPTQAQVTAILNQLNLVISRLATPV
jgi:hypothetical protein